MYFIAKLGAVGAVGFASTTGASVQAMEAATGTSDFLAMDEAPLTVSELQESRGGFSFGGFDFDFGIDIAPIQPIPEGGLFGGDGLFGDDGVFDGQGVFGDGGGPVNEGSANNAPTSIQPTVGPPPPATNNAPSPVANNTPAVVTSNAPLPVATNPSSPSTLNAPPPATNNAPPPVVANNTPPPATNNAPAAAASNQPTYTTSMQSTGLVAETPAANTPPDTGAVTQGGGAAPTGGAGSSNSGGGANPSISFGGTAQNIVSRVTQTMGPNGRTVIIDNNMNGAQLRQTIDVSVRVLNFDSRINRAIADTVTSTLASRNYILNAATAN